MIGYVTIGTNDFDRAVAFFDALLGEFGAKQLMKNDRMVFYGREGESAMFSICKPYDGKPATVGNGVMIALAMGTQENCDRFHAKALELGATDDGAPGARGTGFYGGYFRDLDGNKFCGFCFGG